MLTTLHKFLQTVSYLLLPPVICLLAAGMVAGQILELGGNQELLPLTSFIVLISLSALAFNWCRVPAAFSSETKLKIIYRAGIDLFMASLLALIAAVFAFLPTIKQFSLTGALRIAALSLHWVFFLLALLLFVAAMLAILGVAREIQNERDLRKIEE